MNITGIITEYNPFHNGHLYHLREAKKNTNADAIICVMSGNFVQRGGPAIIDKWKRTEMALNNGVDLIIELPTYYAVSSAEFFAKGSVSILHNLGIVNNLFFGSECGDVDKLTALSKILVNEDTQLKSLIKEHLAKGDTFAKAREKSLIQYLKDEEINKIITSSNNILGIEYIKSILRLNSTITPSTLKREGSNYNDKNLSNSFSSATAIRELLKNKNSLENLKNLIPKESYEIFSKLQDENYPLVFDEDMFKFIKYKIQTNCINFNNLYEITEGLENKLIKEITSSNSYEDFILKVKSKRYTYSKISRILTHIYLGLDSNTFLNIDNPNNLYARVLGFNNRGREVLSLIKRNSSIPLITKVPRFTNNPLLQFDIQATAAYANLNNKINPNKDYLQSPIIKY
ncbi:nucleotidyltransferase [uncultured Clostridium sp.]|uniref:nucleotidyltransferase n=1 Tax=Clostridium sp. TaxID=1506 RepID=UPI0025CFB8B4|nr:nucleotidyltransferase [uncultured Clostridium sp.]